MYKTIDVEIVSTYFCCTTSCDKFTVGCCNNIHYHLITKLSRFVNELNKALGSFLGKKLKFNELERDRNIGKIFLIKLAFICISDNVTSLTSTLPELHHMKLKKII